MKLTLSKSTFLLVGLGLACGSPQALTTETPAQKGETPQAAIHSGWSLGPGVLLAEGRKIAVPSGGEPADEMTTALVTFRAEAKDDLQVRLDAGVSSADLGSLMLSARRAGLAQFKLETSEGPVIVLTDTQDNRKRLPSPFLELLVHADAVTAVATHGEDVLLYAPKERDKLADLLKESACSSQQWHCDTISLRLDASEQLISAELFEVLAKGGVKHVFLHEDGKRVGKREAALANADVEGIEITGVKLGGQHPEVEAREWKGLHGRVGLLRTLQKQQPYFERCYRNSETSKVSGEGTLQFIAVANSDHYLKPKAPPVTSLTDTTLVECITAVVVQTKIPPIPGDLHFTIRVKPQAVDAPLP